MFDKIGDFAVKHKVWIILGWVVLALLMFLFAPALSQVGTMTESSFLPGDSESLRCRELIAQYFPESQASSSASLVFYNAGQLNDDDLAYAREVQDWLISGDTPFEVANITSIFNHPEMESSLKSPDGTTMLLNVGLEKAAFESDSLSTTRAIRSQLESVPEGLEIYVSGQVGVYADLFESLDKSITLTTIVTVLLVVILLIIIFRSPVAALVPLITIGIAYLVARGIIGIIAGAGVSIWSQIDAFLIVMIFGIGTDYCLFLVSRFREELVHKDIRSNALRFAVSKIGSVITASAFAVIVGLAGMAVARYQMIQTMGPILGVAIFITLLAALTLAPATTALFGRKLFWPRHEMRNASSTPKRPGIWDKLARLSTGKPIIVICVVVIVMLLPYFALPNLTRSFDQLAEIPPGSESVKGFNILKEHYNIGEMDPVNIIVVAPEGRSMSDPESLAALSKISSDLQEVDGILKVQSIVQPEGTGETPAGLTVSGQLDSISGGITTAFSSTGSDPSVLFSDQVDAGFARVNGYLDELEQNFTWVEDESSFQALMADIDALQQTIEQTRSAALVETQLKTLSSQIGTMGYLLTISASSSSSLPPQTVQFITQLVAYFDELAEQYPAVRNEASYQSLYATLTNFQSQAAHLQDLSPEQAQALMAGLPGYLQQITADLDSLAAFFEGSGDFLFSTALAEMSMDESPLDTLQQQFASFMTDISALGAAFAEKGNPVFLSPSLLEGTEAASLDNTFFSHDKRATRLYVVLGYYPQSDLALNVVTEARQVVHAGISGTALENAEIVTGGTTAEMADVRNILDEDFTRVMIVVLAAIFIVLALLLRSLVAPLYLLVTVLLSYATTLGISSWIFQDLMGQEGISFVIPIIIFVLLIALGSDYNIFLMSRVKEESLVRPTREGARLAAIATGGVITACGIILAGTFGALVVAPINTMMQIGATVAIGILIDTFIVRALLVPAIASLLGRWNWWPGKHG
ncbi:MAG: MMPL family transporter [Dehalococcoidales bacterium]|nr:MMPL family transporter [Dehalococcoidales bacterium]